MVQEQIVATKATTKEDRDKLRTANRTRIISPKRKKYESDFEKKHLEKKYVKVPTQALDTEKERNLTQPEFDAVTKDINHSKNVKMRANMQIQENIRQEKLDQLKKRTLRVIEDEAEVLIRREVEVNLSEEMTENLMRVFEESKPEEFKDRDTVALETFFTAICEDPWFDQEDRMNNIVRETLDHETETLDALLARISTEDYTAENQFAKITWMDFMAPFCRRSKLRPGEQLIFTGKPIGEQSAKPKTHDEMKEEMADNLKCELRLKQEYKQN